MAKVPAMLIVGDRETESGNVALRMRKEGDLGPVSVEAFSTQANEWIRDRTLNAEWPASKTSETSPER